MSRSREKGGKDPSSRNRSRSPLGESPPPPPLVSNETFSRQDLMQFMSDAMSAQLPRLIVETSKVVQAQMQSENLDSARSFTAFSHEMKKMKLRQEEVESTAKAASLKTEGAGLTYILLFMSLSYRINSFSLSGLVSLAYILS